MDFCPDTLMLLEEITNQDKLLFKSNKTGTIYAASDEHTLLVNESTSELQSISKYKQTLMVTAYSPINPKKRIPGGCEKCNRKIVSFQRLSEENRVVYVCICGFMWSV